MTKPDPKSDNRVDRVDVEVSALELVLDRLREGLVERGMWPRDGDPDPEHGAHPAPYVAGDTLLSIARTLYLKTKPARNKREGL